VGCTRSRCSDIASSGSPFSGAAAAASCCCGGRAVPLQEVFVPEFLQWSLRRAAGCLASQFRVAPVTRTAVLVWFSGRVCWFHLVACVAVAAAFLFCVMILPQTR